MSSAESFETIVSMMQMMIANEEPENHEKLLTSIHFNWTKEYFWIEKTLYNGE